MCIYVCRMGYGNVPGYNRLWREKTGGAADAGEETVVLPHGYKLVWSDEFTGVPGRKILPDSTRWWYETGGRGWGNNELQHYVAGIIEEDTLAYLTDGTLKLKAIKLAEPLEGNLYASVRLNSVPSWQYGYFEARLKLPEGYGTWPAF